jgi:cellulose synthase/poly-beta-1,6-N-acetylglucosamine synthase-like glycosyltransferase
MILINYLAWAIALIVSLPLLVIVVESFMALLPATRGKDLDTNPRPVCGVLVPAHNEEAGLGNTLRALLPQLGLGDRLVVIADNCTDRTADVARTFGVEVVERDDPHRRSKLHAVNHGVRYLEQAPPAVVIVVDADCIVSSQGIDRLTREVDRTGHPIQAAYVMETGADPGPRDHISAFAFLNKNVIRPLGLARLGLPCLLTGSGMAFPWSVIRDASIDHSKLADDFSLSVDLALAGMTVHFCPEVEVVSELPPRGRAAYRQRKRWEQGHLTCLLTQSPRLVWHALKQRRMVLVALACELSVMPLSLLFLVWMLASCGLLITGLIGGDLWPASLLTGFGVLAGCSILANWVKYGRRRLPARTLLLTPYYVCWKVPMYLSMLVRPQRCWLRSERAKS